MPPPVHPQRQGLDFSIFPSENVVLDLDLGLVQGQLSVRCASLGRWKSFSELWFTRLEDKAKNVPIPRRSGALEAYPGPGKL